LPVQNGARADVSEFSAIDILDPRGRADRKGLIVLAAVLIGAQSGVYGTIFATGLRLPLGTELAVNAVFFWLGFVAIAKRMHDLGLSSTRLGMVFLAWMTLAVASGIAAGYFLGEDAMLPGSPGFLIAAAVVMLPAIAATLWLHCAPGVEGANRFGPAPGISGFSRPRHNTEPRLAADLA
jgi:uncharacterized membrane protein YhaH (DUF805 family)